MLTDALLIFGAGGHGRVVADAARAAGATGLLASDRNPALCQGELLPGIPLHRPEAPAPAQATALHVAIGHNAARERESQALGPQRLRTVCHPAASVSPFARLGAGSFVAAQAVVAPGARLGRATSGVAGGALGAARPPGPVRGPPGRAAPGAGRGFRAE